MNRLLTPAGPHWRHQPAPTLTPLQRRWLTRPGPLTQALRRQGTLALRVTHEYQGALPFDEAHALQQPAHSRMWIREIVMSLDGVDCVAARSITPYAAARGVWRAMRGLGGRPLADILYDSARIQRSPFSTRRLRTGSTFGRRLSAAQPSHWNATLPALWVRDSVFWQAGQPLLVSECFLPAFWAHLAARRQQPV